MTDEELDSLLIEILNEYLAETKDEEAYTTEHFHMRPLEYMESLGWTGPDVWYAHGIHFNRPSRRELGMAHSLLGVEGQVCAAAQGLHARPSLVCPARQPASCTVPKGMSALGPFIYRICGWLSLLSTY